jgi:methyl-accepting chemotaxis protein
LISPDEAELIGQFREDYNSFIGVMTRVVELIRSGRKDEARKVQFEEAGPLADRLERRTNQLVNRAEADMVAAIETTEQAYRTSQFIVIGFALGSILLALGLGYVISWSLIEPVREIGARLRQIAAGDFTQRVRVVNRDELSTLASDLNRTSEELGRLYKQLEEASRHKSEFLANTSHELRTERAVDRDAFPLRNPDRLRHRGAVLRRQCTASRGSAADTCEELEAAGGID